MDTIEQKTAMQFGDPLGGGFYAGPHPTDPKAVLILAPRAVGETKATWKKPSHSAKAFGREASTTGARRPGSN